MKFRRELKGQFYHLVSDDPEVSIQLAVRLPDGDRFFIFHLQDRKIGVYARPFLEYETEDKQTMRWIVRAIGAANFGLAALEQYIFKDQIEFGDVKKIIHEAFFNINGGWRRKDFKVSEVLFKKNYREEEVDEKLEAL